MPNKVPEVYDHYNRPVTKLEAGGGERITESAGYVPVRVQVENMIIAGQRLGEYRKERYDFGEGMEVEPDVVPDPTRSPNFDMADGSRLAMETTSRLKAQKDAADERKRKEDASTKKETPKPEA